jgi:hypothetical protein
MAGKKPTFVTGLSSKIKLGGKTVAYAMDTSYVVNVDVVPVETLGRAEAAAIEPVNYTVAGELTVVRYTSVANGANINGTVINGNGLGNLDFTSGGNACDHVNPGNLLLSQSFDLEIYQKTQTAPTAPGQLAATNEAVAYATIRDCRFTRKSGGITKRGIYTERYSFVGILADDDSFDAAYSGDIDFAP